MFNLDAKVDKTVDYEYRGIVFKLKVIPDIAGWRKAITETLAKQGVEQKDVDNEQIDNAAAYAGMSMAGTMVVGCDLQSIMDEDDVEQPFDFDGLVDHPIYTTQGEALLGETVTLQDHLYGYCMKLSSSPPDYEVRALGKSLKPSDSGGNETLKAG